MKTMIAALLLISSSAMATTNDNINIKVLSYCQDNQVVREVDEQIIVADDCEAKSLTCVDYVNQRGTFVRYAARCEAN